MDPLQDIPFESIRGYRVVRRLATGGTSDVLLAKAEGPHGFERTVVLKLLLAHFRNEELMARMFAREASAYARLSHPAIVKLYDFFAEAGQLVMALEYVDGLPLNRLRAMLKQNGESLDDRASIFIAARVFAALAAAHAARDPETAEFAPVIHRDVNPSNVLIPWDGHVKLADFGIAKVAGVQGDTQAGFIKGTYGYMAPEQVKGEPITVRADVYAASLLLWELLARRKAIQRGALPEMEVLRAMAEPSIVSLDVLRPDLPARLRSAVARGLEPTPDQRAITAEEMLVVLRESVTSNEGRMVLEATLSRVRQPQHELSSTHPRSPNPLKEPEVHAAIQASLAAQGKPPLPEETAQQKRARGLSEPDLPMNSRTIAGLGGAESAPAAQPMASVPVVAPRPGAAKPAPPRPYIPTLRMGVPDPPVAESEEQPGSYRAVGTPARPIRQERTIRGMSPVSAPPGFLDEEAPRTSPMPAPMLSPRPEAELPSALSLGRPDTEPSVPAHSPPMPAASLGVTAPMAVPLSSIPPPMPPQQPAAPFDPFAATMIAEPGPSQPHPQPFFVPQPQAMASAQTLASAQNGYATNGVGAVDPRRMPTLTNEARRRGTAWALIALIAVLASVAIVAVMLMAQGRAHPVTKGVTAATLTAPPPPTKPVTPVTPAAVTAVTPPEAVHAATSAPAAPTVTAPAAAQSATPPVASATPPAPPAPAAPAAPSAAAASPEGTGDLTPPPSAAGHRIYFDGKVVGDGTATLHVKCGAHTIKIGSSGVPQPIEIPCGGSLTMEK